MLDVDETERLTGEEEFELLSAPLGLSERKPVPEAVHFPDTDPLGASVAMVTATNSMEETLLQIGKIMTHTYLSETEHDPLNCSGICQVWKINLTIQLGNVQKIF